MKSVADIRKDYKMHSLNEQEVSKSPFKQFHQWFEEAIESSVDEVNAMTLATASAAGVPSARIVLLKGYDENGFVFFTNYNSYKGQDLAENPRACLVFFWKELERQIRITGLVQKVSPQESDEYFLSRPSGSRIGAWVSPQSQVIRDRKWLDENETAQLKKFEGKEITRPNHWGGYKVKPITIEFWQGRSNRLHDRIQYSLDEAGEWKVERLAP